MDETVRKGLKLRTTLEEEFNPIQPYEKIGIIFLKKNNKAAPLEKIQSFEGVKKIAVFRRSILGGKVQGDIYLKEVIRPFSVDWTAEQWQCLEDTCKEQLK